MATFGVIHFDYEVSPMFHRSLDSHIGRHFFLGDLSDPLAIVSLI